jgi:hypothetical protein
MSAMKGLCSDLIYKASKNKRHFLDIPSTRD